eukprot:Rhum_TRINITY_DN21057_c0_g1::Rhum_TRINITY_DN21057_c0_g1_i1::g.173011::m.173011
MTSPGTLTERIVLQKTKLDNLSQVKNLNVWGSSLDDVSIVKLMPNVSVLSLSVNKISSLSHFAQCTNLTELYLRKNEVASLEQVQHLKRLPKLKILWLCDNPCAADPLYRQYVIRTLPTLEKLDNNDVLPEERNEAARLPQKDIDAAGAGKGGGGGGARSSPAPSRPKPVSGNVSPSHQAGHGSDRTQTNVLTAVLALLNELSPASLESVQHEISQRLNR